MNLVRDSGVDLVLRSIEFSYTSQRQKFFKYDFECTHDLPEIDRDCETNYRLSPTVWRQNVGISITAFCTAKRFEDRENEYWADSDGLGLHFNLTTQPAFYLKAFSRLPLLLHHQTKSLIPSSTIRPTLGRFKFSGQIFCMIAFWQCCS